MDDPPGPNFDDVEGTGLLLLLLLLLEEEEEEEEDVLAGGTGEAEGGKLSGGGPPPNPPIPRTEGELDRRVDRAPDIEVERSGRSFNMCWTTGFWWCCC